MGFGRFVGALGALSAHSLLTLTLALALTLTAWRLHTARAAIGHATPTPYAAQTVINDSTAARASHPTDHGSHLEALDDAAHTMHGTTVAGVHLRLIPDTVHRVDTLVVHDQPDGTRTATVADSTSFATLSGTITAPVTGPIRFDYQLLERTSDPTLGMVEVNGQLVAVVTWRGKRFTMDAPYVNPRFTKGPRLHESVGGWVDASRTVAAYAGASFEVLDGMRLTAGVEQRFVIGEKPELRVGVEKVW